MDDHPTGPRCQGRIAVPGQRRSCEAEARFEIARHVDFPLPVCPLHLGPALLEARNVVWPPRITLLR
ncbi:hypothetical protein ACWD4G_19345 [Streptomyces sp. NPDC002643]